MRGTRTRIYYAFGVLAAACLLAAASAVASSSGSASWTIWRVAGTGVQCSTAPSCRDGGPATSAQLNYPQALAVREGYVYLADWGDNEVRRIAPDGTITIIAGGGTTCQQPPRCGDGGPATSARLTYPDGVAVNAAGDVFIADSGDNEIREVTPQGVIKRIAGTGAPCAKPPSCGDGGAATAAQLTDPTALALDSKGNLYIADSGDQEIRKLAGGAISRVAGTGHACTNASACGASTVAANAQLRFPQGLAVDSSGNLFIADTGDQEIKKVTPPGAISVVAGTGSICSSPPSCGDGGPAVSAKLSYPSAVGVDGSGNLFIADSADNEIREVAGATINRVAGTGSPCSKPPSCGDNQSARLAELNYPEGIALDAAGNLYVADSADHTLRWLSSRAPAQIKLSSGAVDLLAFSAQSQHGVVQVHYVVGQSAAVTLLVRVNHHWVAVGKGHASIGFNQLSWNGEVQGKRVPAGSYRLMVTATIAQHSASSTLSAQVR